MPPSDSQNGSSSTTRRHHSLSDLQRPRTERSQMVQSLSASSHQAGRHRRAMSDPNSQAGNEMSESQRRNGRSMDASADRQQSNTSRITPDGQTEVLSGPSPSRQFSARVPAPQISFWADVSPPVHNDVPTPPRANSNFQEAEETERIMRDFHARQARTMRGRIRRVKAFFGYGGNKARKELVQLIWTLAFGLVQFAVVVSLLAYSSARKSKINPAEDEWKACDKPLGVWDCLWIIKVVFDCCMSFWSWSREQKLRSLEQRDRENDAESPPVQGTMTQQTREALHREEILREIGLSDTPVLDSSTNVEELRRRRRQAALPYSGLFSKLNILLSLFVVAWFIVANIFLYTSLHTCRHAAPHLWWLTFGVLCLQYFMIVEVFVIAVVVFIIGPLVYLFWNLFLICLGRHPLQNPHYINPEIGKLPKAVVEKIPLVLYIPPPPDAKEETAKTAEAEKGQEQGDEEREVIIDGVPVVPEVYAGEHQSQTDEKRHTYPPPPSPPVGSPTPKSSRFSFILSRSPRSNSSPNSGAESPAEGSWEDSWERGPQDLPFVRLAGNRAVCAVCLMDFEAPKRRVARNVIRGWRRGSLGNLLKVVSGEAAQDNEAQKGKDIEKGENVEGGGTSNVENSGHGDAIEEIALTGAAASGGTAADASDALRLQDAGDGPQPLRLLPCGHVFHKTCIDPWLCDVSGRCPTCQRPVTFPDAAPKKGRGRTRRQT